MRENQKRIGVFIPIELYQQCTNTELTMTELVSNALESYLSDKHKEQISQLMYELELKETRIKELENQIKNKQDSSVFSPKEFEIYKETMTNQFNESNDKILSLHNIQLQEYREWAKHNDELHTANIKDLQEQLKVKDSQLEKKDIQIENLTASVQSQALNIHNLLTQKALQEPKIKKWFEFWK
jgi:hypothetical protein